MLSLLHLTLLFTLSRNTIAANFGGCLINNGLAAPTPPSISSPGQCTDSSACGGEADIVFAMDGSGSISSTSYSQAVQFLRDLAMSFAIGQNLVHIGMIQWSGSPSGEEVK